MQLSTKGLTLIQQFEGFRSHPYRDSRGIATIGYGSTFHLNGTPVTMNDPAVTQAQASQWQQAILNRDFVPHIANLLAKPIASGFVNQNMFDACCSLAYNIGLGAFEKSQVLADILAGHKISAASDFTHFETAGGEINQGLVNRRNAERKLFLS